MLRIPGNSPLAKQGNSPLAKSIGGEFQPSVHDRNRPTRDVHGMNHSTPFLGASQQHACSPHIDPLFDAPGDFAVPLGAQRGEKRDRRRCGASGSRVLNRGVER